MKNPTILKDELGLLRADRSAVITELRNAVKSLNETKEDISRNEAELEEVLRKQKNESARLEELRGRAVLLKKSINEQNIEVKSLNASLENLRVKNSQEAKLHLGRIKELKDKETELRKSIGSLKEGYEKNANAYNKNISESKFILRKLNTEVEEKSKELKDKTKEMDMLKSEEAKLTKDRLKREDKIRAREKALENKEFSLSKKEEDLTTLGKDMMVIYGRMKELYAKVDPNVDLDKLIIKIE